MTTAQHCSFPSLSANKAFKEYGENMRVIDMIKPEPRTYQGHIESLWNHTQTNLLIKRGTRILVSSPGMCWNCKAETLLKPYTYYCSPECTDRGDLEMERQDEG